MGSKLHSIEWKHLRPEIIRDYATMLKMWDAERLKSEEHGEWNEVKDVDKVEIIVGLWS